MSAADRPALPATLDVPEAAMILGVCRDHCYDSIAAGQFPIAVLRLGRRIKVPTRPLLALLGLDDETALALLDADSPGVIPER